MVISQSWTPCDTAKGLTNAKGKSAGLILLSGCSSDEYGEVLPLQGVAGINASQDDIS